MVSQRRQRWRIRRRVVRHTCDAVHEERLVMRPLSSAEKLTLVARAQLALHMNNIDLAKALRISRRTVTRWFAKESAPDGTDFANLAHLVYPKDAALAEELMTYAEWDRQTYKLPPPTPLPKPVVAEPPPAPPAPPAPAAPPPDPGPLVDAVLCAASEKMGASPTVVRPVLYVAFARARELGLSLDVVETRLAPPAQKPNGKRQRPR
jgi:hypothetical protein